MKKLVNISRTLFLKRSVRIMFVFLRYLPLYIRSNYHKMQNRNYSGQKGPIFITQKPEFLSKDVVFDIFFYPEPEF